MTDIVKHQAPASLPDKMRYAEALAVSGMLPGQYRNQPANLLWAMEFATSLDLHPMQAITGVHVIEGKPSASAALISALVRRAGHKLRVRGNDLEATAQIVRADDPDFTFECTWTMDRAHTAGLTGKKVWKQYPAAMLKARAITEVAREACEEALSGMHYTPEELGANVDAEGNPVPAEVQQLRPVQQSEPDPWATPAPAAPPRNYVHEAHACNTAAEVRQVYRDALANHGPGDIVQEIAAIGAARAAAEQQTEPIDAEVISDAEQQLRDAAARADLPNLDDEFQQSYGCTIADATPQQLAEMTSILTGAAA